MEKLSASSCSLENTLSIIAGKWKSVIIYYLLQRKVCRFSELQKLIPDCSKRMLALQLKDLEKAKIINKKVYPVVPPKTEYSLTDLGKTLFPVIKAMDEEQLIILNYLLALGGRREPRLIVIGKSFKAP